MSSWSYRRARATVIFRSQLPWLEVSKAQTLDYDRADPLDVLVHDMIDDGIITFPVLKTDESDWHEDGGSQLRKDVQTITSFILLSEAHRRVPCPQPSIKTKALPNSGNRSASPAFGSKRSKTKTVLAQPVVLKAIEISPELGVGKTTVRDDEGVKKLWESISSGQIDFRTLTKSGHLSCWIKRLGTEIQRARSTCLSRPAQTLPKAQ